MTQGEYERMVEFIRPATEGWKTHAYKCSALTHDGLPELWAVMRKFEKETKESGVFQNRRKSQLLSWVRGMIDEPYPAGRAFRGKRTDFPQPGGYRTDPLLRYGPGGHQASAERQAVKVRQ